MNIYHQPYTYLIGWSNRDRWYYGVRYGQNCHPNDLWKTYFTSSKLVEQERLMFGEPDIIEVRRVFDSPQKAMLWEDKVLKLLQVDQSKRWINERAGSWPLAIMSEQVKSKISTARKGTRHSEDTKKKMSAAHTGKVLSKETKERMSEVRRGMKRGPMSEEQKRAISATKKGNPGPTKSEETKKKIAESLRGRKHSEEAKAKMRGPRKCR